MQRILFFLTLSILFIATAISALALPSIVPQNSQDYTSNIPADGLVTLYPSTGTFDVPNDGGTVQSSTFANYRIVFLDPVTLTVAGTAGTWLYVTPTQINIDSKLFIFIGGGGTTKLTSGCNCPFRLEKNVSGVWTATTNNTTINMRQTIPSFNTVYATINGEYAGWINAILYGWNGSTYVPLKSTADGAPNPKVYGGRATIISFYLTGAYEFCPGGGGVCFQDWGTQVKVNGTVTSGVVGAIEPSGFPGLQQLNYTSPSGATQSTTFSIGAYISANNPGANPPLTYGATGRIPYWQ